VEKFYVIFGNLKNYMSRIGKLPVQIPSNVVITIEKNDVTVKGKFGELKTTVPEELQIQQETGSLTVNILKQTKSSKALHGLYRSLINNMVTGVSSQFQIILELKGVGYRAAVQGNTITLNLGYSHPVIMTIPDGISIEVVKNTTITLKGCDKEALGLFASQIRKWRVPEPYKGKGIKYENEVILRKAGKSGKK